MPEHMTWARVGARKNHLCKTFTTTFNWWLVRVALMVVLTFCPKILGSGRDLQIIPLLFYEWRFSGGDTMRWADTQPLPYAKDFKLFEPIALKGNGDRKTRTKGLALTPTSHLVKLSLPNIYVEWLLHLQDVFFFNFWGVLICIDLIPSFLYSSHSMNE